MNIRSRQFGYSFIVMILLAVMALFLVSCGGAGSPEQAVEPEISEEAAEPEAAEPEAEEAASETEEEAAAEPAAAEAGLAEVQHLRFGIQEEDSPQGFDPISSSSTPSMDIQKMIYNALLRMRPDGQNYTDVEPDLATHWDTSEDGLTWTFYLQEGVQFQKGFGELTSEDVVFSLERARADGASWAATFSAIESVEALDPYTVRITLNGPDPYFLYKMSNSGDVASVIVSKKAVEEYGDDYRFNPIGSGPFQFEAYFPKQRVVLVRNDDYFRGTPILEQVEYIFIPELQAQTLAIQAGEIDMMRGLQDKQWADQMREAGLQVLDGVPFSLPLALNMTVPPFDDLRVRQAIMHGIDQMAFAEFYGEDFIVTDPLSYSPWPWHMREYQAAEGQVQTYEYDPEKAKALLAEAGYPDGFSVDLTWTNQVRFFEPIQIVQAQLQNIGITLNLNIVEHSVYREVIDGTGQAMAMISISRDTPDAVAREWFLTSSIPPEGATAKYNYAHYGEAIPGVDDLIEQALVEMDPEAAVDLYVQIQQQVMEDLPVIPLYQGWSEPFALASYVDLGYEWHAPDRRYPVFTEDTRILEH